MAAGLALTRANITTPHGVYPNAAILVRQNRAVIRKGRDVLLEMPDVTSVVQTSKRVWTITSADAEWTVQRVGGCGCGGAG